METADAMNRPAGGSWVCPDYQEHSRGFGHGVAPLSYDAAALRPSHNGLAGTARPRRGRGQPDAVRVGRAVRDWVAAARRAPEPDAHQPGVAGAAARRPQSAAPHRPPVDPGPAGRP